MIHGLHGLVHDFAKRTRHNLEVIRKHQAGGGEAYEVTQLVNSMLGLLILPQEHWYRHVPAIPLDVLAETGWPAPVLEGEFNRPQDLRGLMRMLRNSIAHFNIKFTSERGQINGLRLSNMQGNKATWRVTLSLTDLEQLTDKFVELVVDGPLAASAGRRQSNRDMLDSLLQRDRITPRYAETQCPENPGLYAQFLKTGSIPPDVIQNALAGHQDGLLYIGKASQSLRKRAVNQDLRHEQPSMFFRTLGAVLGFRPPTGSLEGKQNQNNYRFSLDDTREIIAWINANVEVAWLEMQADQIETVEKAMIQSAIPPLNTQHNPAKLSVLQALRAECRAVAKSDA